MRIANILVLLALLSLMLGIVSCSQSSPSTQASFTQPPRPTYAPPTAQNAFAEFPKLVGFNRSGDSVTLNVASKPSLGTISVKAEDDHGNVYTGSGSPPYGLPASIIYVQPININIPAAAPITTLSITGIGSVPVSQGTPVTYYIGGPKDWYNRAGMPTVLSIGKWEKATPFCDISLVDSVKSYSWDECKYYNFYPSYPSDYHPCNFASLEIRNVDYNDIKVQVAYPSGTYVQFTSGQVQNIRAGNTIYDDPTFPGAREVQAWPLVINAQSTMSIQLYFGFPSNTSIAGIITQLLFIDKQGSISAVPFILPLQ